MSDLVRTIRDIQREVGVDDDGIFGPVSAAAVLRELRERHGVDPTGETPVLLDARTEKNIATLDPEAQPRFRKFMCLAKATAATLGFDYVLISGNRSYSEQDELYAQGRTKPGKVVTRARGGQSNHNFGIAADAGVFNGRVYVDEALPSAAAKVHKACAVHARECGLEWGGSWNGFVDLPHYEVATGLGMAAKRRLMNEKGSVMA